jgi:hypothetical protein
MTSKISKGAVGNNVSNKKAPSLDWDGAFYTT